MNQAVSTIAAIAAIAFSQLPALGAEFEGGTFRGITTLKDGTHAAVILLPDKAPDMSWVDAVKWAESVGGKLPTRPIAALLYANAKDQFERSWHWLNETLDADTDDKSDEVYAWICGFDDGYQYSTRKRYKFSARAVRLIPLVI